jgi:hypothetical protein
MLIWLFVFALVIFLILNHGKKREKYSEYALDNHQCDLEHPCPLGQKCALSSDNTKGICLASHLSEGISLSECGPDVAPCPYGQQCVFYGTHYGCTL